MKNWRVFYQLKEADPYRWLILFSLISVWGKKPISFFFLEVANYPVWQTIQSLSVLLTSHCPLKLSWTCVEENGGICDLLNILHHSITLQHTKTLSHIKL